eukprot:NODE_915_length_1096_cov_147.040115_g750_i0.p1 GENE.NODE_915_length_1096_cov_147.040115_g750_i0~~NODE_915_length_1096_cov_147.040115_g750_i0.p1  ORF type:complete len:221 (-),score=41.21 NODE_915_length_1096_cov_147.040115_g750_i0:392-1054(-)
MAQGLPGALELLASEQASFLSKAPTGRGVEDEEQRRKRRKTKQTVEVVNEREAGYSTTEADSSASATTDAEEGVNLKKKRKKLRKRRSKVGVVEPQPEPADVKDERTPQEMADARVIKHFLLSKAHKAELPHLLQPDLEMKLRRVATKGVVRLFNAVAATQLEIADQAPPPSATGGDSISFTISTEPAKAAPASKSKFLEMLRLGVKSKQLQKPEDAKES